MTPTRKDIVKASPAQFKKYLQALRDEVVNFTEVKGKNNRSYLSGSSVKRNMQRRRTP